MNYSKMFLTLIIIVLMNLLVRGQSRSAVLNPFNICAMCETNEHNGEPIRDAVEFARDSVFETGYYDLTESGLGLIFVIVLGGNTSIEFLQASKENKGEGVYLPRGQKIFYFVKRTDRNHLIMRDAFSKGVVDSNQLLAKLGTSGLPAYSAHCGNMLLAYCKDCTPTPDVVVEEKLITKPPVVNIIHFYPETPTTSGHVDTNSVHVHTEDCYSNTQQTVDNKNGSGFWSGVKTLFTFATGVAAGVAVGIISSNRNGNRGRSIFKGVIKNTDKTNPMKIDAGPIHNGSKGS